MLQWNGASLFCYGESQIPEKEWDKPRLIIHGTDNLVEFNQHIQEKIFTTQEQQGSLILFCKLPGTGDSCGLDPRQTTNSEYVVLDCFHELLPVEWRQTQIASSFAEWLERIFDQVVVQRKYPEYWLEAESSSSFSLAEETPFALIRQGVKKAQQGDYQQAIADFDRLIQLNPKNYGAYYERGNISFTLGDYQQAIADYTHAINLEPNSYVIAYNKRGLARIELKEYQEAIVDFSQALQINPRDSESYQNRGNARCLLGDNQGAMEDYQKAAELRAEKETAYSWGEYEETTGVLEEFIEE